MSAAAIIATMHVLPAVRAADAPAPTTAATIAFFVAMALLAAAVSLWLMLTPTRSDEPDTSIGPNRARP